jgi:hypothetical protein
VFGLEGTLLFQSKVLNVLFQAKLLLFKCLINGVVYVISTQLLPWHAQLITVSGDAPIKGYPGGTLNLPLQRFVTGFW